MIDALSFLRDLKNSVPPPVVHLAGDDVWIRETVRGRIGAAWCGIEGNTYPDRLVGTTGIAGLAGAAAAGSLFAERKVIVLADPGPGEKGKPLSGMGKNQLQTLVDAIRDLPTDQHCLVIETGPLKKSSALLARLSGLAAQVDTSQPTGAARAGWIKLLARRSGVTLGMELMEAMTAASAPLGVLVSDLEKLALAVPEGEEPSLELWKDLSQADPEATVWEIGDHLGAGKPGSALASLRTLETGGHTVHEILPSLLSWNQQRLRVKSHALSRIQGDPKDLHPFVVRKIGNQVARVPLSEIRREQKELLYLDRCTKQSWENPHTVLEKFLVTSGAGGKR
jgi:DNA polymerase III delta subunit